MKKKFEILFVDDNKGFLKIAEQAFVDRDNWVFTYCHSGKEALDLVCKNYYDLVITDMRMKDVKGSTILEKVKEISPKTIRFIISGYSNRDYIVETVNCADQFLSKPFTVKKFDEAIRVALKSFETIDNKEFDKIGAYFDEIPTLPKLYTELTNVIQDKNSSMLDIVKVIEKDIVVTAKVMQLANSALFGNYNTITKLSSAVSKLGLQTIKSIVISKDLFHSFGKVDIKTFEIHSIYKHSFLVSRLSQKIALNLNRSDEELNNLAMASMLHDIGKIILIMNKKNEYRRIMKALKTEKTNLVTLEKEILGISHAEVGAYLLKRWNMPDEIVNIIQNHHNPRYALSECFNPASILYMANILANKKEYNHKYDNDFDKGFLTKFDLIKYLPEWEKITNATQELNIGT